MPPREKRRFPRVKGKGVAAYLKLDAKTAGCVVEDISAGGLFLRTDRVVPVGTRIALDLVDPEAQKAIQLTGQVVGIILKEAALRQGKQPGLRIRFLPQRGATAESLQRLLTRLGATPQDAPVFYAVTRPPPQPRAAGPAGRPSAPPVLHPVTEGTNAAPLEEDAGGGEDDEDPDRTGLRPRPLTRPPASARGFGAAGPEDSTMIHEGRFDDSGEEEEEEETEDRGPVAATRDLDGATLRLRVAELEAEVEKLQLKLRLIDSEHQDHLDKLNAAITERDRRIAELREEAKALRLELAGGDQATPVRAPPRRR